MAKQSVIAFFTDREIADAAVLSLRRILVPGDDLTISPAAAAQAGDMPAHVRRFWTSFDELFDSSRDRAFYAEGVRRGYVMVVAQVQSMEVGKVAALLERHGAADLDACDVAWRSGGWAGEPAAAARDQVRMGARSTDRMARQIEIDRAAASVLAAASARGAYRFRSAQHGAVRSEAACERPERPEARDTPFRADPHMGNPNMNRNDPHLVGHHAVDRDETGGSSLRTGLDRETVGSLPDGGRPASRVLPVRRAEGFEVVCNDGQHVGVIEGIEGATMRVRSRKPAPDDTVRSIPTAWIHSIDDRVVLNLSSADITKRLSAGPQSA